MTDRKEYAFPLYEEGSPIARVNEGLTKREYVACAAMNLPNEQLNVPLLDEDMVEDVKGYYIKSEFSGNYYVPAHDYKDSKKYSIKKEVTYEKRLVRFFYKINI